ARELHIGHTEDGPGSIGIEVALFDIRQQVEEEVSPLPAGDNRSVAHARRQMPMHVVVLMCSEAELLQVVGTLGAAGGLTKFLDGRQEQADEDGDDGDDHQQLDQREAGPRCRRCRSSHDGSPSRGYFTSLLRSQTLTMRSRPAETRCRPSRLNARLMTMAI